MATKKKRTKWISKLPEIKIDCSVRANPINRYLLKVVTKKYTFDQKVQFIKTDYVIQWKNLWIDVKQFFRNPFGLHPLVGYSIISMLIFLIGREEKAMHFFMIGALTLDSATESNNTATFNVTVASNSNRMMIMGFGHYQSGNNISGATYNGDALTVIKAQAGSFGERAGLWGLVAPDTGTNSFVISGNDSWTGYGVISVYDVDQTLPATTGGASGDSSTASASLTTTVANAWVVAAFGCEPTPTMTTSSGVEDMKEQGASYQNAEMHHVLKATAGSQTMSCSLSYGARWNVALCQLKPYVATSAIKTVDGLAKASVKTVNGLAIASVKTINGLE